ncbi:GTPase IMAP family member 7 [Tachysurus vachellii]|uniref:GTPase IMAP family member 7 n=1 Tax=Tachysurus vachellii TaxID=175792 RepID=UPI00296A98E6|nr:GTPase IMAP family member 7 [Tachysurus vachellii]
MEEKTTPDLDGEPEELRDSANAEHELRLVLLGWTGTGKSSMGNGILGTPVFDTRRGYTSQKPVTMKCEKGCASVAGRQVVVVDTPDWFYSERPLEEVYRQLALCESLSSPGPHAFLLCISVHRPCENLQALDALEKVFGLEAITKHTIVLFTDMDQLSEGQTLQEFLNTEQKDLLELLQRCGDRYHVIRVEGEKEEEKSQKCVEELLEKVEEMVKQSGKEFYICPPLPQTEETVRRMEASNEESSSNEDMSKGDDKYEKHSDMEREASSEKMEPSADGLEVEEDIALSPPAPPPSFLHWVWDTVVGWVLWLPNLLRGTTLLGSVVGLFFGGAMGATVGSVATEVSRRKNKAKVKTK